MLLLARHFLLAEERGRVDTFLRDHGMIYTDVTKGTDAWTVAHHIRLTHRAYALGYCDGHIQTYLQKLLPNVVFKEKPRY
jgi:hypothetical protein